MKANLRPSRDHAGYSPLELGDRPRVASIWPHHVQLAGEEGDQLAIRRLARRPLVNGTVGEVSRTTAVTVHRVDLVVVIDAAAGIAVGDLVAVGGPAWVELRTG